MKNILVTLFLFLLNIEFALLAQKNDYLKQDAYTSDEKIEIILKTKQLVVDNYVIIDKIDSIQKSLDELMGSKIFDTTSTKLSFRRALASQLRNSSNDPHFAIFPVSSSADKNASIPIDTTYGIQEVKYLEDKVGYFKFNYFPQYGDTTKRIFCKALEKIRNARAIIVDLSNNYGGNPYFEAFVCSFFFRDSTHLYDVYSRKDDSIYQFWTTKQIDGPRFADIPAFVITSENTFSAGEAFAYDLQVNKRAKIVGQQTSGGANPCASFFINDNLKVFIPVSKVINLITRSNWEEIGVIPDIIVPNKKEIREIRKQLRRLKYDTKH